MRTINTLPLHTVGYDYWYVLHVESNKTDMLIRFIKRRLGDYFPAISFTRELIHFKKQQYTVIEKPLFPGYLFVHKQLDVVQYLLRENFRDIYVHPVCFDGKPATVNLREMQYLFSLANHQGKVELSKAYREGDSIIITSGPLYNVRGQIRFIDTKKRKVKISFPLLNTMVDVSLSYDLVEKEELVGIC